jgi:hypothetical protein
VRTMCRVTWHILRATLDASKEVRFQVLTAASMMFRIVFWDILPCKMIVERRFPDGGGSTHL